MATAMLALLWFSAALMAVCRASLPAGYLNYAASVLNDEPNRHLEELGKFSDDEHSLARTFFSPSHKAAAKQLQQWMEDAGMESWIDMIGNVHGRVNGSNPDSPALVIGSHYDTVLDGGKYDGALGIIVGISAIKATLIKAALTQGLEVPAPVTGQDLVLGAATSSAAGALFRAPVHLVAFTDEEGVRFQSTFLGSRALTGKLIKHGMLSSKDKEGNTVEHVLKESGVTGSVSEAVSKLGLPAGKIDEYFEVHIEQGPVLEQRHQPLGVVSGIAGQTRLWLVINGTQGHAGTVPMFGRKDSVAVAAVVISLVETACKGYPYARENSPDMLVCTVGEVLVWPGASNVIAGSVQLSIDIRAKDDKLRLTTVEHMSTAIRLTCNEREVKCDLRRTHDAAAVLSDEGMVARARSAIMAAQPVLKQALGGRVLGPGDLEKSQIPTIVSGAGHDGLAMAEVTKIAMMFVRNRGGISHSPLEHVDAQDTAAATAALAEYLTQYLMGGDSSASELGGSDTHEDDHLDWDTDRDEL